MKIFLLFIGLAAFLTASTFSDKKGWITYEGIGKVTGVIDEQGYTFVSFGNGLREMNTVAVKELTPGYEAMFAGERQRELIHDDVLQAIFANHKGEVVYRSVVDFGDGNYGYFTLSAIETGEYLGHTTFVKEGMIVLLTYSKEISGGRKISLGEKEAQLDHYLLRMGEIYSRLSLKNRGKDIVFKDKGGRFNYRDRKGWTFLVNDKQEELFSALCLVDEFGSFKRVEVSDIDSFLKESMAGKEPQDLLKGMMYVLEHALEKEVPGMKVVFRKQEEVDGNPVYFAMIHLPKACLTDNEKGEREDSLRGFFLFFKDDKYIQLCFAMNGAVIKFREERGLSKDNNDVYFNYLKDMYSRLEVTKS